MAEVKFARQLASNDGKTRSRAFRSVRRWLSQRSAVEGGVLRAPREMGRDLKCFCAPGLDDAELLKLWKGLYVCMWHSDKPVVQVRSSLLRGAPLSMLSLPRRNWLIASLR